MSDAPAAYSAISEVRLRDCRGMRGATARRLHLAQRIQDDQGRSVLEHLVEDMSVPAPATAHVDVTAKGGVSGPYPWRRPA